MVDEKFISDQENAKTNLQVIFDNTPYALLIITGGVFVEANEAAFRIFKAKNREDIIGKPPAILSPPLQPDGRSSDDLAIEIITRALDGSHEVFEWLHRTLEGTPFFARVHLKAFTYNGKPSLMTVLEDISEQKAREEEISISHHNMQTIFDTTPYAMLVITEGVFVEANNASVYLFGAESKVDLIGKPPAILSPPSQPDGCSSDDAAIQIIQRAIAGSVESFDWVHRKFDGTLMDCHVTLAGIVYNAKSSLMVVIQDLTEQRRQQKEIQVAQKNMQTVFDTSPFAIQIITGGEFVSVNAATISLFGAKATSDLIGKPPGILSPEKQYDGSSSDKSAMVHIQQAMSGKVETFDWIHQKLDGTQMDCHVILAAIEYNENPSLMCVVQDLTEQRRQQNEIRVAQKNMQTIFDTTPYAMLVITDGKFVDVNEAAVSLFGAGHASNLIGKPPGIVSPPLQADGSQSDAASMVHIRQAVSGKIEVFDWIHQKFDGIRMDCHVTLAGIEYNGRPSLMSVVQDLTEQRRQQREILFLKERADLIIEKNPALMFVLNTDLRVIKTNQAWIEVSGYSNERLLSMKINDFTVTDRTGGTAKDVLDTGTPTSGTIRLESPNGTLYLRYFYIPMHDENGKIDSILAVYFDETSLKKLQIQLDSSIAEVGRILSLLAQKDLTGQAHIDPQDPLMKVKENLNGTVSDLRKTLSGIHSDSESLLSSIRDINRSTDDLAHASNDVADTSQYAADEITKQRDQLESISRDVSDLSASIEEIAASAADVRDITKKVSESGEEAQQQGVDATRQMKAVEEISGTTVEQIRSLNNQMQEIGKIVKLISDIANQTNLLALNAAIEAARAGDAGRGFAVVAGEVKNLAGESRQATANIEEVIARLMAGSNQTAESIEKSHSTIVAGIRAVNATIEGLDRIVNDIGVASGSVSEISRATDSQAEATNRVNQNIEIVSRMVTANQEKMDSLSANAEESSAATEEIASASAMIVEMVEKLQHKIGEFTV